MKNSNFSTTSKKRLQAPVHADFDDLAMQINLTKPTFFLMISKETGEPNGWTWQRTATKLCRKVRDR